MPLITDPDDLNQGVEVVFDATARTIQLLEAGNLSSDGVTMKALYSFVKEERRADLTLKGIPPPIVSITDESYEFINGWNFADDASRYLIRTSGWSVVADNGNSTEIWAGIIGLGDIGAADQIYYESGAGATDFQLPGQVNQAIQVYSDPNGDGSTTGGFDWRNSLVLFVREQGKAFGQASISDIGVTTLSSQAYRFPLGTGNDLKVSASDVDIQNNAPYTGMSITYHATSQARDIGGTNRDFGIVIDGNNGTAEQIYEFVQFQLRQNSDIDADADVLIGKTADELLEFVGDTLRTKAATNPSGGGTGVFIDNFLPADTNRIEFTDNTGTPRTFPFVAGLTLQFNSNLQNDPDAVFAVFFTDVGGSNYGDTDALLVNDADGNPIQGSVAGRASVQFSFDYDGNAQGGRTPGTDADITVMAIGLNVAQEVVATETIRRATANTVGLVAALERNYENPN